MLTQSLCKIFLLALCFCGVVTVRAQKVLNSTGNSARLSTYNFSYSLGETATQTLKSSNGNFLTQGVLQPILSSIPSKPLTTLPLDKAVCINGNAEISFVTSLVFAQDNEFSIELSDENGNFSNPIVIGKIKGTTIRKVPVELPNNLKPVTYLMRVVSSNPKEIGQLTNLLVRKRPNANFSLPMSACTGDTVYTTFTGKDTIKSSNFIWNFSEGLLDKKEATGQQGNIWSITGSKPVSLLISNDGCLSEEVKQNITIDRRIAPAQITCGTPSGNAITFNWAQVGGAITYKTRVVSGTSESGTQKGNSLIFNNVAQGTKIKIEIQASGPGACGFSVDTQTCTTIICPNLGASLTQNSTTICAGEAARTALTLAGGRGIYLAVYTKDGTNNDTLKVLSGQLFDFFPEQNTNYTFLSIGSDGYPGCFTALNRPRFQVTVTPNNFPGKSEPALLVCDNQSTPILLNDLLKEEFDKGSWSSPTDFSPDAFDPDAGTFIPKGNKPGKYFFVYTVEGKNGCRARSASVEINLEKKQNITIKDYSNCADSTLNTVISLRDLSLQVNPSAPNTVKWYNDQALTQLIRETELPIKVARIIYGKSGQGVCASEVTPVTLKLNNRENQLPKPVLEGTTLLKVGDTLLLRTTSSYPPSSVFYWQKEGQNLASATNLYELPPIRVNKSNAGRYTLLVSLPGGKKSCNSPTAFIDIQVLDKEAPKLEISKVVGENAPWMIKGLEAYQTFTINIFNRWGELVHTAKNQYLNDWTGTCTKNCNGAILSQGTYYYEIIIQGIPKDLIPVGAVYVVRTK